MLIEILAYMVMFCMFALSGYAFYLHRRLHKHLKESEKELAEFKNRRKREGDDKTVAEWLSQIRK